MTQSNSSKTDGEYHDTLVVPFELLERVAKRNNADYQYPKQRTAYIHFSSTEGRRCSALHVVGEEVSFPDGGPFLVTANLLIAGERLTEPLPESLQYPSYNKQRQEFQNHHTAGSAENFWTKDREDEFDEFWETHIMKEWRSRVRQNIDVFESDGERYQVELVEGDE